MMLALLANRSVSNGGTSQTGFALPTQKTEGRRAARLTSQDYSRLLLRTQSPTGYFQHIVFDFVEKQALYYFYYLESLCLSVLYFPVANFVFLEIKHFLILLLNWTPI